MRAYDLPNYDNWLNRYNPYDDELDEELEEHLGEAPCDGL